MPSSPSLQAWAKTVGPSPSISTDYAIVRRSTTIRGALMANDEHVALLKKGMGAWNAWRDENPDIRPDLVQADLRDAYLSVANLQEADLFRAYLHGANLSGANLTDAELSAAVLDRAVLIGAKCSSQTNLRGHASTM